MKEIVFVVTAIDRIESNDLSTGRFDGKDWKYTRGAKYAVLHLRAATAQGDPRNGMISVARTNGEYAFDDMTIQLNDPALFDRYKVGDRLALLPEGQVQ